MMSYKLVLASGSPRRQQLLRELRIPFTTRVIPVEEDYPDTLTVTQVAAYLAEKKGEAHRKSMSSEELIITADTVVVVDNQVLNKPIDHAEAQRMLRLLSGRMHQVITAVSLTSSTARNTFTDTTNVYFRTLTSDEIDFYVEHYRPFDKAGSYAIQEWIGMIGIEKIEGSYFNVVGLPVEKLYQELRTRSDVDLKAS